MLGELENVNREISARKLFPEDLSGRILRKSGDTVYFRPRSFRTFLGEGV